MKLPKKIKKYCPKCKKHTEMTVTESKRKTRSSAHPMSRGSTSRIRGRGKRRGYGNLGRYSKPTRPKMTGKKVSKKTDLRYKCSICSKTWVQKQGKRTKKVEFV